MYRILVNVQHAYRNATSPSFLSCFCFGCICFVHFFPHFVGNPLTKRISALFKFQWIKHISYRPLFPSLIFLRPADDCQHMFLHPVNVRCLLREYGSLEASPDSITATVVEIEGHTVTEVSKQVNTKPILLRRCRQLLNTLWFGVFLTSAIWNWLFSLITLERFLMLGSVAGDPPQASLSGSPAAHMWVQHLWA